jgi:hypothetical protein
MSDLRSQLENIASQFVSSVLAAMKSASLGDLAGEAGKAVRAPAAPSVRRRPGRPAKAAAPGVTAPAAAAPAKRGPKPGKRYRASAAEVQAMKDTTLATAKTLKPGFSKGDIMKKSGSKVNLGRALTLLVDEGKLSKKGDRRTTRYWVK